jgi:phosphate-selective porin OprO/OprP
LTEAERVTQDAVARVERLEEQLAVKAAEAVASSPPSVTADEKSGFSLRSGEGTFVLRLHAQLQLDGRWFLNDGALSDAADTFLVRRMRPSLDGTVRKRMDFKFVPDFAGGTTQVFDAYLDVHPVAWLRFRVGKFKTPLGLERLQQDQDLPFMERALTQNLTSQRDVGISVWGEIAGAIVTYNLAILNGSPDGSIQDVDANHAKDFAGRLLIQPFKAEPLRRFGAVGLHFGASTGNRFGQPTAPQLPSFKSGGQNTFFAYLLPSVAADPTGAGTPFAHLRESRLNPGLFYYVGPVGLLSEYVWSRQEVQLGGTTATLTNQAVHGTLSFVVGGRNGYDGATPTNSLNPARGTWGALEIAGRWNYLKVGDAAFGNPADATVAVFADRKKSASQAQGWAGALTYVPSRLFRVTVNFERTTFTGGSSVSTMAFDPTTMKATTTTSVVDRRTENALLARTQIYF